MPMISESRNSAEHRQTGDNSALFIFVVAVIAIAIAVPLAIAF